MRRPHRPASPARLPRSNKSRDWGCSKNRPLPSTVTVTLLGISTPASPRFRSGRAMMSASRSPETSPTNCSLTPLPSGRSMLSQAMSSADHRISVWIPPYKDDLAAPLSPQVLDSGPGGASTSTLAGSPQAPRGPRSISPSKGNSCAESDFFSG